MMVGCGRSKTIGFGEVAVCGEHFQDEGIYHCETCKLKEAKQAMEALVATSSESINLAMSYEAALKAILDVDCNEGDEAKALAKIAYIANAALTGHASKN